MNVVVKILLKTTTWVEMLEQGKNIYFRNKFRVSSCSMGDVRWAMLPTSGRD